MKSRKFLVPLAALVASFSAGESQASMQDIPAAPTANIAETVSSTSGGRVLVNNGEDQFSFILRRAEDGQMIAAHESHYSHRSHQSHRSHYSSR